jgi:hypothetical protein
VQTKNADGTTSDMTLPDPHLVTDFERMVELRNALQPDSPFMTACSPGEHGEAGRRRVHGQGDCRRRRVGNAGSWPLILLRSGGVDGEDHSAEPDAGLAASGHRAAIRGGG